MPYETVTLIRIAEIASKANQECPELNEVTELPIILAGGSDAIIRAAKSCIQINDETDRMKIEDEIKRLRSQAKYKSVEEALRDIE